MINSKGDISNKNNAKSLTDFDLNALLCREIASFDCGIEKFYKDKTVLVTGGGGSVGSELCRSLAALSPKKIIIFDICENGAYELLMELNAEFPEVSKAVEIGSVRDVNRLDFLFNKYKPEVVFHAAAHKHVPLMEENPEEAIKNNILGTYNVANAAEKYGVERFVLISTDKAVNPVGVMGVTKRISERIVLSRDKKTSFSAVRFGNVLGSAGSVVPLFKRQIERGGPVTLTDKRAERYFMSISEAARLLLSAGAMAGRGELFVLDMGKPVKIYDLAKNMIIRSGLVPEVDIEIREAGLRPGEKLLEELIITDESFTKTENDKIFVLRDTKVTESRAEGIISLIREAITEYEITGDKERLLSILKGCLV